MVQCLYMKQISINYHVKKYYYTIRSFRLPYGMKFFSVLYICLE